ncbi:SDR family NAD(P)-dependent oxidoreductase [Halioxenophilus sp. WMMB6]|uniref:SDR family NAD(P)-dependent oxidoreductase n=1 Tax=Halioxenophilus sp. WMMB6 TaxID=3073815 RepID=UPI00295F140D|nr:SDR family NAD(P)-dependent oxidoreductase [Halioxenophilus sp. WMMB6]
MTNSRPHPSEPLTAVVTGASSGIGKETAKALAGLGYRVFALGRDPERLAQAGREITAAAAKPEAVSLLRGDFALLADSARLAVEILAQTDRIDVLVNNAGGVNDSLQMTAEGFEQTFTSNYLSPFLFTQLLLPALAASAAERGEARVLATSSIGHHSCPGIDFDDLQRLQNFTTGGAYTSAKLGNILFTRELAKRYGGQGITAHAMEPGVVLESNFVSHADATMQAYMGTLTEQAVTSAEAAKTLVWLASHADLDHANGGYFYQLAPAAMSEAARDDAMAERLWAESMALVAAYLKTGD